MTKALITNKCPKCKSLMEVREHKKITETMLSKPYYFTQWCFCRKCKHLQHYEKYKVKGNTILRDMGEIERLF